MERERIWKKEWGIKYMVEGYHAKVLRQTKFDLRNGGRDRKRRQC